MLHTGRSGIFLGALAFDEFLELMPEDSNDEEIAELLDLIVHEPQKGGIFGAGPEEYAKHRGRIRALVDILTNESDSAF